MLIEVLRELVIARGRNVEDTDTPLTNAFPEPTGIENASTCFSIHRDVGVSIQILENWTLDGVISSKTSRKR